jgi:hypothetical protein
MFMRVSVKSAALLAGVIAACVGSQAWADGPVLYDGYKVPHDSLGRPDLTAIWSSATITRLERKPSFGQRLVMTPQEVEAAEGRIKAANDLAAQPTDPKATVKDLPADCSDGRGKACNYNSVWTDPGSKVARVHGEPHTSILTTPDGRVPLNLKGQRITRGLGGEEEEQSYTPQPGEAPPDPPGMNDNPETRALTERCLTFGTEMLRSMTYNNNHAIQQGRDFVAIESEMIHEARIVRLNSKHRTDGIKQWGGDSIGWYEGDTLVVETIGLDPRQLHMGSSDQLKVTERFTRVAPTRLHYAFKFEDAKTWAKPWGGEYEFTLSPGLYEYACHEGNYGLPDILAGARAEEARAKLKKANSGG